MMEIGLPDKRFLQLSNAARQLLILLFVDPLPSCLCLMRQYGPPQCQSESDAGRGADGGVTVKYEKCLYRATRSPSSRKYMFTHRVHITA